MKRIIVRFIACLPILFFMQVHAQILYEGMYSSEWEQERDEFLRGIERRRQEQERAIRNLNISIPTQPTQSTQSASTQRNNASRQAAINAKRKAHNLQVQKRNQQLAALNRQRQIEAEKRRREEERLRKEAEQRKREEIRQRVTAETYQRLEGQTRSLQAAAAYASGEGGYRLREQHDVSRYEKPIQRGTGNAVSQIGNSPRQKFSFMSNSIATDTTRTYQLPTWEMDNMQIESKESNTPSILMQYTEKTLEMINPSIKTVKATKAVIDSINQDVKKSKEQLMEEGDYFERNFTEQLRSASTEELEQMAQEWEDIEKYAYLAKDTYKDGNGILPKGYERISETDEKTLSPMEKELKNAINNINDNVFGFNCELYKTDKGNYVLSFRGTELDLDKIDQTKGLALIPFAKDAYADLRGALITEANGNPSLVEPQAMCARGISNQVTEIFNKYNTLTNKNGERPSIACTGHSLGGRLAQEAALENDLQAIVFNSADLSSQTKENIKKNNINTNNIKSIVSSTDPLTKYQRTNIGKTLIGEKVLNKEYVLMPKVSDGGHSIGCIGNEAADRRLAVLRELDKRKQI